MAIFPRPQSLRRPGQNVLRNETVFIGLPRGNVSSSSSSSSNPTPPVNPPETVTYVAPNGSDATGERGNPLQPFLTINAALAVSQDNDVILLAPGTYEEVLVPNTLNQITLRGMGSREQAYIRSSTASAVTWFPSNNQRLVLEDLTLGEQGGYSLLVQGGTVANSSQVLLKNVFFEETCFLENLAFVEVVECQALVGLFLVNINEGRITSFVGDPYVNITDPIPPHVSRNRIIIENAQGVESFLEGNCWVEFDRDCNFNSIYAFSAGFPLGEFGRVKFAGKATLVFAIPNRSVNSEVDLRDSQIVELIVQLDGGVAPVEKTVDCRGAQVGDVFFSIFGSSDQVILDTRGGILSDYSGFFGWPQARWRRDPQTVRVYRLPTGSNELTYQSVSGGPPDVPGAPWPDSDAHRIRYTVSPVLPDPSYIPAAGDVVYPFDPSNPSEEVGLYSGFLAEIEVNVVIGLEPESIP